MRKSALEYLACPECRSELETENIRTWKGDIRSGHLKCRRCGLMFPIVVGRPVLMTSDSIDHWKAPVDEALGIDAPVLPPLSIPRLVSLGIDEALKMAEAERFRQSIQTNTIMKSTPEIPGEVIEKMKYRDSGEWFKKGNRAERHLKFPWKDGDPGDSFNIFMKTIVDTEATSLLDLASGGGSAVSHQVYLNRNLKQTLAVERDLKCLGNIQYRFKHIGRGRNSEAVGGDVRYLPVKTECIDTVMMLGALPEICGVSVMLKEACRVLRDNRYFILKVQELPFSSDLIPLSEFLRFAGKTDLYAGFEKFLSEAEGCGFQVMDSERFTDASGRFSRLMSLMKK
jgi:uncharacterized protein YbaR (Trm112 family)